MTPALLSAVVPLDDGRQVRVRPVEPDDDSALAVMHRGLSAQTVLSRFFAPMPELPLAQASYFTHVDGRLRVAVVAVDDIGRIVAVARYDRLPPDFSAAEVAFVVTDDYQRHGLGTRLVRLLTQHARDEGVKAFVADVLLTNTAMWHAFSDAGLVPTSTYDHGVAHLLLPLS